MFNRVGTVSVFVSDQQRAKDFYVNTLGFELKQDAELYPGATSRWVSVAPRGAETEIVLYAVDENWSHYAPVVGKSQALTLNVSDIEQLVADLKAKGVAFQQEVQAAPWGKSVFMYDSEGNTLLLVEQPKF